jgi:anti-anti-sigma factor
VGRDFPKLGSFETPERVIETADPVSYGPSMTNPGHAVSSSEALELRMRHLDDTLTVELVGEMDLANARWMTEQVQDELEDEGVTGVEVNLAALQFVDSSGLAALVRLHNDCASRGRALRIHGARRNVRRVIEIAGLAEVLPLDAAVERPRG